MPITYYEEEDFTKEPDSKFLWIPLYLIGAEVSQDDFIIKCLKAWKLEEVDYDFCCRGFYYTDKGINALVYRLYLKSRRCYWRFLRVFYWIGLIDTKENESFSWGDFFRIKIH